MLKLEIGGGPQHAEGYFQLDKHACPWVDLAVDASGALPFPAGHFVEIRAVHVLEHIERARVMLAMSEWLRVLAPGGILYVSVPDMSKVFRRFLDEKDPVVRRGPLGDAVFGGEGHPEDRHKTLYDLPILEWTLTVAGFKVLESGVAEDHHTIGWRALGIEGLSIFARATK